MGPLLLTVFVSLLPPANEVCEGYVFTPVCLSTGVGDCLGPDPGGMSGGGGVLAGMSPGPHLAVGVSRPRGCIPACTEADPPLSRGLLLRAVRIILECILVWGKKMHMWLRCNTMFVVFRTVCSLNTLWSPCSSALASFDLSIVTLNMTVFTSQLFL